MYKTALLLFATLLVTLVIPGVSVLRAEDADDAWKNLIMQALYAAGENQYAKAEATFNRAVHEAERFGPEDSRVGTTLNSLGLVYKAEKKFIEAEGVYRKALAILERAYGPDSVDVANVNFNIGTVMMDQQRHTAALPYLHKTLQSYEGLFGGTSAKTASVHCLLGESYRMTKNYPEALSNYKRCADIREADNGVQNPELADALHGLALTYVAEGKYYPAEASFKLAEKIVESTSGIASPQLADTMRDHIALLKTIGGREKDVERLTKLSESIRRLQAKKRPS